MHIPVVLGWAPAFTNLISPAIPDTWTLILNAIVLGLLAGIFEETARYVLFRYILKRARTWEAGVLVGTGHGGIEAMLLGIAAAIAFVNMSVYRGMDLSAIPTIPADQLELAKQQVAAYWSAPVYIALLGVVERVFAICLHLALSATVLYSLVRKQPAWFWLALLWHALVDALAVYLVMKAVCFLLKAWSGSWPLPAWRISLPCAPASCP